MASGFKEVGTVLPAYRHISDFFGRCDKFFTFAIHIRIGVNLHRAFLVKLVHEFFEPNPSFEVTVFFWNTCYKEFRLFVACGYGHRRE